MKWKIILTAVWMVGVAARASFFTDADINHATLARQHVFMVNKEGGCMDPAHQWGWDTNALDKVEVFSVSNSLHQIEDGLRAWSLTKDAAGQPTPRVIVFVHGGMNPYSASRNRLQDTNFLNSLAASNCYPIFVVWNSGPFSSYWEHLTSIRQGEKHPWIGGFTAPFVLVSDLARGVARLPTTLSGRIYSDWETTEMPNGPKVKRWENFEELIVASPNAPAVHPAQHEDGKRTWPERGLHMTEYIATQPTKIATLPILDGLGTEAWDIMLRRTRTLFDSTGSYEIGRMIKNLSNPEKIPVTNRLEKIQHWLDPVADDEHITLTNAQRGAMYFLSHEFAEWSQTNWLDARHTAQPLAFEFYGHSMGTIVLNEMFRNQPSIMADRVAYLAAACSIEDFKTAMFPYLTAHTNTQFYSLSLPRIRERDEFPLKVPAPFVRDLIVRGSLLNWIDDILAKPNSVTDRTLGAWENLVRALPDIPADLRPRTHFRECDLEPQRAWSGGEGTREPQVHADFTKTIFWSTNFLWPARTDEMLLRKN